MEDLDTVIEDSLTDSQLPEEPEVQAAQPVTEEPAQTEAPTEPEVKAEAPDPNQPAKDEFEAKFGIAPQSPSGRENRIPYSRVKKITEKAVKDAQTEWEKTHTPKYQEAEAKLKDYETKLGRYTQFEQIMVKDPERFLTMLSNIPAYTEFFKNIETAFAAQQQPAAQPKPSVNESSEGMPQPNQRLADGSMVYDLDGLQALLDWKASQVEKRITKQIEERYKPIESEWEAQRRVQELVPQVQSQIAEARTWPLFNENEEEIVKILGANPSISLEGAYRQAVMPKMVADRNKIREEVLREVKQAPKATSVPVQNTKATQQSSGPRSLEEVIADQIKNIKS